MSVIWKIKCFSVCCKMNNTKSGIWRRRWESGPQRPTVVTLCWFTQGKRTTDNFKTMSIFDHSKEFKEKSLRHTKQRHIQMCDRNSTYLYLHHKLNQTVYRWVFPSELLVSLTSEVQGGPWKTDKDVHSETKINQSLITNIIRNLHRQMRTNPTCSN